MSVCLTMGSKFWETMNLLIGKEYRRTGKEIIDDVEEWVEKVVKKEISMAESDAMLHMIEKKSDRTSSGYFTQSYDEEMEVEDFMKSINLPKIDCRFNHPQVTSRLEKLMGSNLVCLTDREYMQKLQDRILEDYEESMDKRIKLRRDQELERVKNLVLGGTIPLSEAPECMAGHPIMLIEKHCKKMITHRRAKIKIPKIHIPTHLFYFDTPVPSCDSSIKTNHIITKSSETTLLPTINDQPWYAHSDDSDENEEKEEGATTEEEKDAVNEGVESEREPNGDDIGEIDKFMFTDDEYNRLKYESPLIEQLRKCQTVQELYNLADEIIGVLKTLDNLEQHKGTTSDETVLSIRTSLVQSESGSGKDSPEPK